MRCPSSSRTAGPARWSSNSRIDDLDRIFDAFMTTKERGMGIGLAVSRTIVEAHGGKLWAENNRVGGATFNVTLPLSDGKS
jgi:signal transduction histidine kinase